MNPSLKCGNCGGITDDFCPICSWELCMECRQKVLEQEKPCCPNCGNLKWPYFEDGENTDTQEAAAKGLQEEAEETIRKNNETE